MMSSNSEKFSIQLRVGNQVYPITVRRETEGLYREATKRINEKLNMYKSRFPNQGEDKYMSMALIDIAVNWIENEQRNDTLPFVESLGKLTAEIESELH